MAHRLAYAIGCCCLIAGVLCGTVSAQPASKALKSPLIKLPVTFGPAMENSPIVFDGRPLLALNYRDDTKNNTDRYKASMYLFLRDLATGQEVARFGQLYLQKGVWQGSRLLPEAWVAEATASQVAPASHIAPASRVSNGAEAGSDWTQGYGYQFWRCRHGAYRGDGVFGQYCVVMPEQDAVLVMTGGVDVLDMQPPLDLLWQILLPAMHAGPLPGDEAARQALAEKCSSLALPPVQGKAASPLSAQVSGRTYRVDENDLRIATIALDFTPYSCTVLLHTAAGEETIPGGYGAWQRGQTTVFNDAGQNGQTPVFASGAWTAEDSFTLVVRLYETPFYYTCVFFFAGDELLVEIRINASLEATKPWLLIARGQP